MTDIFSEAGIARWQGILANSAAFEVAASGWRGTLLLVEAGTDRSTWLKLADGSIEEARPGTVDDRDVAEFVLDEARANGAQLPVTALVDQFYADVQLLGGGRWDTSSLIARLDRSK